VVDSSLLHKFEITEEDLANTPPRVLSLLAALVEEIGQLRKRIEELESRLNLNSSNSSKPPSSDPPFKKKPGGEKSGKAGGKKGHKGHRQVLLEPSETRELKPEIALAVQVISRTSPPTTPISGSSFPRSDRMSSTSSSTKGSAAVAER
jgi:hypothetical protein